MTFCLIFDNNIYNYSTFQKKCNLITIKFLKTIDKSFLMCYSNHMNNYSYDYERIFLYGKNLFD